MAKTTTRKSRAAHLRPEDRKKQLLRAGVASFASKGIGGTKHADLARACGVSVPAVFTYLPNREVLVRSVLEDVGTSLLEKIIEPAKSLKDPAARLPATATLYEEFAGSEPDYVRVWLMWSMHFAPEIQSEYRKFENVIVEAIAQMILDGNPGANLDEDVLDRARMILASSAFLAKMVFDGISENRRQSFVQHILQPLTGFSE